MRTGILIIGSLLWDNCQREAWRRSRLHVDRKLHVKAPICYGRRSQSRGNTFTMTLTGDASGTAVLVPCVSAIVSVAGLVAEAAALWGAERATERSSSIGASWGSVGVLLATTVPAEWRAGWAAYFRSHASPLPPVDDAGTLRIAWPVTTVERRPANVDIILTTATKAEATRPTATEISDAWVDQSDGHERYFFENIRHGIRRPMIA